MGVFCVFLGLFLVIFGGGPGGLFSPDWNSLFDGVFRARPLRGCALGGENAT